MNDGRRTDSEASVYDKLTYEPSARGPMVLLIGPVNAHLISGPSISINHTKPDLNDRPNLDLNYL